ncbi:MAG: DUF262 domain-containing protein, partial [Acidimicrobiia bacterium]|nr:DUF262 domain-containing protein [Acidimicrobiia bacterium]
MPLEINTEAIGLGAILRTHRLGVPIHQRSFAWEEEEVRELWEDLERGRRDAGGYFVGPVVLSRADSSDNRLWIVDGQQRLATVSLLLAGLVAVLLEHGDVERSQMLSKEYLHEVDVRTLDTEPTLVLGESDDQYFRRLMEAAINNGDLPEPDPRRQSHILLKGAYEYLKGRLATESRPGDPGWVERLLDIKEFVDTSLEVILVNVDTDQNAYLIFETLNDRGMRLTPGDLLKNHLFGTAGSRLTEVHARWADMMSQLDGSSDAEIIPEFLRHYWIATVGMVRSRALFRTISKEVTTPLAAVELAEGLAGAATTYAGLNSPLDAVWRGHETRTKSALTILQMFRVRTPRSFLLAAAMELTPNAFAGFVEAVKNWSVRMAIAGGLGSGSVEEA